MADQQAYMVDNKVIVNPIFDSVAKTYNFKNDAYSFRAGNNAFYIMSKKAMTQWYGAKKPPPPPHVTILLKDMNPQNLEFENIHHTSYIIDPSNGSYNTFYSAPSLSEINPGEIIGTQTQTQKPLQQNFSDPKIPLDRAIRVLHGNANSGDEIAQLLLVGLEYIRDWTPAPIEKVPERTFPQRTMNIDIMDFDNMTFRPQKPPLPPGPATRQQPLQAPRNDRLPGSNTGSYVPPWRRGENREARWRGGEVSGRSVAGVAVGFLVTLFAALVPR